MKRILLTVTTLALLSGIANTALAETFPLNISQQDLILSARGTAEQNRILDGDDITIYASTCIVDVVGERQAEVYCSLEKDLQKGFLVVSAQLIRGSVYDFSIEYPVQVKKVILP